MTTTKAGWLAGGFMTLVALAGWALDFPYVLALPAAFLIAWWGFTNTDRYLSAVLFLVPLSVNLSEFGMTSIGWYMPTEPMLFACCSCSPRVGFRKWTDRHSATSHDVGDCLGFAWMGFTILPSSDMVVSLKAWISRAWFILSFYVVVGEWVRTDPNAKGRFLGLLAIPLCGVIAYTLVRHANHGFSKQAGHWVMKPFFKDHTSYGAVLAMMLPPAIAMAWRTHQSSLAGCCGPCAGWLALGIVFFTRAAWVSLAAAGVLWIMMLAGVRFKALLVAGLGRL